MLGKVRYPATYPNPLRYPTVAHSLTPGPCPSATPLTNEVEPQGPVSSSSDSPSFRGPVALCPLSTTQQGAAVTHQLQN